MKKMIKTRKLIGRILSTFGFGIIIVVAYFCSLVYSSHIPFGYEEFKCKGESPFYIRLSKLGIRKARGGDIPNYPPDLGKFIAHLMSSHAVISVPDIKTGSPKSNIRFDFSDLDSNLVHKAKDRLKFGSLLNKGPGMGWIYRIRGDRNILLKILLLNGKIFSPTQHREFTALVAYYNDKYPVFKEVVLPLIDRIDPALLSIPEGLKFPVLPRKIPRLRFNSEFPMPGTTTIDPVREDTVKTFEDFVPLVVATQNRTFAKLGGVYIIRRIGDKIVYIGSAIDLHRRLSSHVRDETNKNLSLAMDAFGPANFEVGILEYVDRAPCISKDIYDFKVRLIEQKYLDILFIGGYLRYNISPSAITNSLPPSVETLLKRSASLKAAHANDPSIGERISASRIASNLANPGQNNISKRPVTFTNIDGKTIKEFASIGAACTFFSSGNFTISKYINNKGLFKKEWFISLDKKDGIIPNFAAWGTAHARPLILTHIDGTIIKFTGLLAAKAEMRCSHTTILKCIRNNTLFRKVWYIRYDEKF